MEDLTSQNLPERQAPLHKKRVGAISTVFWKPDEAGHVNAQALRLPADQECYSQEEKLPSRLDSTWPYDGMKALDRCLGLNDRQQQGMPVHQMYKVPPTN